MNRLRTFAYGSNMDQGQMAVRCPSAKIVGVARLAGHRVAFNRYSHNWEGGVADIVTDPESIVWGLVWDLSESDLAALDEYEGYPSAYTREPKRVALVENGHELVAWVYAVVSKSGFVPPRPEYLHAIVEAAREFGFPSEYVERLEATETLSVTD